MFFLSSLLFIIVNNMTFVLLITIALTNGQTLRGGTSRDLWGPSATESTSPGPSTSAGATGLWNEDLLWGEQDTPASVPADNAGAEKVYMAECFTTLVRSNSFGKLVNVLSSRCGVAMSDSSRTEQWWNGPDGYQSLTGKCREVVVGECESVSKLGDDATKAGVLHDALDVAMDLQHTQQLQHRAGSGVETTDFEVAIQGKGSPPTPAAAPTVSCGGWDYANAQCKNHGMCEYRYQFGDFALDHSCRCRNVPIPVADCECEWDYSKARCAALGSCEYRYEVGDMTLEESCRIKDADTLEKRLKNLICPTRAAMGICSK